MAELAQSKKSQLLNQMRVKNNNNGIVSIIYEDIKRYENLSVEDFKNILPAEKYNELLSLAYPPNPDEEKARMDIKTEWDAVKDDTQADLQQLEKKIADYLLLYRTSAHAVDVNNIKAQVCSRLENSKRDVLWEEISEFSITNETDITQLKDMKQKIEKYQRDYFPLIEEQNSRCNDLITEIIKALNNIGERGDWNSLNLDDYDSVSQFIRNHPNSSNLRMLKDWLWIVVLKGPKETYYLQRYNSDFPGNMHNGEILITGNSINDEKWDFEELISIGNFSKRFPSMCGRLTNLYNDLKQAEIQKMVSNPSKYRLEKLDKLFHNTVFTKQELVDNDLVTEDSLKKLQIDRTKLPQIKQAANPGIEVPGNSTDVFFFGIPGTGKTCLLMGLVGANGQDDIYSLDMSKTTGRYASDLSDYVVSGVTPGRTFGNFVAYIHGDIRDGNKIHKINLIEMSGEEFAIRIVNNEAVDSFEAMGTGATNLLANNNRKVFFIVIDPTSLNVHFEYMEDSFDNQGNRIQKLVEKIIFQPQVLTTFTSLIEKESNSKIMSKVDAIHVILTKADTISQDKYEEVVNSIRRDYKGAFSQLRNYCKNSQRINRTSNYVPHIFPFSLGKFYLGDVFSFDNVDTMKIIDVIKNVTFYRSNSTWWKTFSNILTQ